MKLSSYSILKSLHLTANAVVLPLAMITVATFNVGLGDLNVWYAILGGYLFLMIWACFYIGLESAYYPAKTSQAISYSGTFFLSLLLFFLFLEEGFLYAVYASFYSSFLALIFLFFYLFFVRAGKSVLKMPWWGFLVSAALMLLTLAYTYQTGISFFNHVAGLQSALGQWVVFLSFSAQTTLTALHWIHLKELPSFEQELKQQSWAVFTVILMILSIFFAMSIASGLFNDFFSKL